MKRALIVMLVCLLGLFSIGGVTIRRGPQKTGGGTSLPGVSGTSFNMDSVKALTTGGLLSPPDDLSQVWISAAANDTGTVATSGAFFITTGSETYGANQWAGYGLQITSGGQTGQIRRIIGNTACAAAACTLQLDSDWPTSVASGRPAAADTYSIFEGELPPGTTTGTCTKLDPCLDLFAAHEIMSSHPTWVWLDAGAPGMVPDEWDTAAEICTDTPAGRCTEWGGATVPGFRMRQGYLAPLETYGNSNKDVIISAISGSDMTGKRFPIINCDRNAIYPNEGTGAAGVFEAETSTETGWYLIQGIETMCYRNPVITGGPTEGSGTGVGIFRVDQKGKMIAFKTRHGDVIDGIAVINTAGTGTAGVDMAQFVGIDVQFNLGNFERWNAVCTALDTPFEGCTADAGTPYAVAGNGAARAGPYGIDASNGQIIWIGGDYVYKNAETTTDAFGPTWNTFYSASGSGTLDMINVRLAGNGDEGPQLIGSVGFFHNGANQSMTANFINVALTEFENNASTVAFYIDGGSAAGRDGYLGIFRFINVSMRGFATGIFRDDTTTGGGAAADRGYTLFGRCNAFDGSVSRVFTHIETTVARCLLDTIDFEGAYDGQDVAAGDFGACASTAADPTALNLLTPGPFALYRFFPSPSFDVNAGAAGTLFKIGDGQDTESEGFIYGTTADESELAAMSCNYSTSIQLAQGRKIPIGVFSNSQPMTHIRVEGTRNFGYN